nr:fibronectin type III domain-containing protein [Bacteroidales bacterium]
MKKVLRFLTLAAMLCIPWVTQAQTIVTIGEGTSSTYYPMPGFYGWNYDVYIYTPSAAAALGADCDISSIAYDISSNSTTTGAQITIWVKDVAADYALAGATTFAEYITGATEVYSNDALTTTAGWNTFNFTTPFSHEAGNALLVAVRGVGCTTGGGCSRSCRYTTATNTWWQKHVDGSDPGQEVAGSLSSSRANIQLGVTYTGAVCFTPTGMTSSGLTHNTATLSWTETGSATGWVLQYGTDQTFAVNTQVNVSTTPSYDITGLTPSTTYYARVKPNCDNDDSHWSTVYSFSTTAVAEAVGDSWSDNFEGASCGWELINGELTNKWAWGTAANNGGEKGLYISNDNGVTNAYTISSAAAMVYATKLLNFTEGKFEFSYDWIANGEGSSDYIRVALVPTSLPLTAGTTVPTGLSATSLPTGCIALDGGSKLNLVTTWQNKTVAVNVAAGNYYLVFAWRNDGSVGNQPPAAIDNVSITKMACPYDVAGLAVTPASITTTAATVTWTAGEATQWQVSYSASSDFSGATEETVSTASYTMTGLNPSTVYYVKVRAYCGGSDYGAWCDPINFHTECAAIEAVGYTQNFDSYTTGNNVLPLCWSYLNTTTYTSYSYYPKVYNYNSSSSPNCLYFYSYAYFSYGSTTYDPQPQYAILPEMTGLAGKQVTLMARGYNATSTFKVGTMSDPAVASTFTLIAEHSFTSSNYSTYQEFIDIIPTSNTDAYLAIMIDGASEDRNYNGAYIDNITIAEPPACAKPMSLTQSNATAHTVDLAWTKGDDESAWVVAYKKLADENFTEAPVSGAIVTGSSVSYTLTGLDPESAYTVKVKADCGSGVTSEYSNTVAVATTIACPAPTDLEASDITNHGATLSWDGTSASYVLSIGAYDYSASPVTGIVDEQNFEGSSLPEGWTHIGTGSAAPAASYPHGGSKSLKFSGATANNVVVLPQYASEASAMTISFWSKAEGSSSGNFDLGYVTNATDASTFVALETYTYSQHSTYQHVEDYDLSSVPAGARIAFRHRSGSTAWYWFIDDVTVNGPTYPIVWSTYNTTETSYAVSGLTPSTPYKAKVQGDCGTDGMSLETDVINFTTDVACPAPINLNADNITTTSADLSWTSNGTESEWTIYYKKTADDVFTEVSGVTDNPYTLDGLIASTPYQFKVAANCSASEESEASVVFSFATECEAITSFPWNENFESYAAGDFAAPCWVNEHITGSGTYIFKVYSGTNGTNATKQLQLPDMYNGTQTKLVLPVMDLPNDHFAFSIDVYRNATGSSYTEEGVRVYASTDGEIAGATELAFISRNYTVTDNNLIPIEAESGWYTYVLPIGFDGTCYIILRGESKYGSSTYMDNFLVTACQAPTGLAYSQLKNDQVTLTWTSDADAWDICINGEEGHPTEITLGDVLDESPTFTYVLTGLDELTDYTVKVRNNCGSDGVSLWSNEIAFTTLKNCATPINVVADNVTNESANVSWDGIAPFYVKYREAAHIDGLSEEFATTGTPAGWVQKSGLLSGVMGGTVTLSSGSGWSTTSNTLGTYNIKINIYGTTKKDWLITPAINLPADAALNFDLALTDFNNEDPIEDPTAQADDRFVVLISNDDMATWTILREWNNSGSADVYNTIATDGEHVSIDLSTYDGQTVYVAFYGESTASGGDNDLHIDNVAIGAEVPAGDWHFADDADIIDDATEIDDITYQIRDLRADTKYEVVIIPTCETSQESDPIFFTTISDPVGLALAPNVWHAIASPMHSIGQTYESFDDIDNMTNVTYDLLRWNESSSKWESQKTGSGHTGFANMQRGRGYIYRFSGSSSRNVIFNGIANEGAISYTPTYSGSVPLKGFNLIGNPYSTACTITNDFYELQGNGMWTVSGDHTLDVGQAVLVKVDATTAIPFTPGSTKGVKGSAETNLVFTVSNGEYTDIAYARFNGGESLPKFGHLTEEAPMLSIAQDEHQYAIAVIADD